MPYNFGKNTLCTKQTSSIHLNNYFSITNILHTSINKETALEKLAIDIQVFLTLVSPDLITFALIKLESTSALYIK